MVRKLSDFLNTSLNTGLDSAAAIQLVNSGETSIPLDSGTSGNFVKELAEGAGVNFSGNAAHNATVTVTVDSSEVAFLTSTQTLTNKTINLTNNTLTGTLSQFNSALSDGTFTTQTGTETFTNKTLTAPIINLNGSNDGGIVGIIGPGSITKISTFGLRDTVTNTFDTLLASTSSVALTTNRTLTVDVQNANRTISLGGDLTITNDSDFALEFTLTGDTNVTMPTSGTVATTADNVATATALLNSRTFSISGDGTAPATSFNGDSDVGLTLTISNGAINNDKIADSAEIDDTKLATIATAGKVSNSATTATATNTVNTIVQRDGSGNFAAEQVTVDDLRVDGYGLVIDSAGVWRGSLEGGVKGEVGDKGQKGVTGDKGEKGEKGEKGQTGAQGTKGQKGEKGEVGPTGSTGNTGDKGSTGEKGQKGEVGE